MPMVKYIERKAALSPQLRRRWLSQVSHLAGAPKPTAFQPGQSAEPAIQPTLLDFMVLDTSIYFILHTALLCGFKMPK